MALLGRKRRTSTPGFVFGQALGAIGMIRTNLQRIEQLVRQNPDFMAPEDRHLLDKAQRAISAVNSALKAPYQDALAAYLKELENGRD